MIAASTFVVGLALTGIGFVYDSYVALVGVLLILGGFAAFGTLSQSVPDLAASPNRQD